MPNKNLILRAVLVVGLCAFLVIWNRYFWTHRMTTAATLLLGLGGVILFRSMVRANIVPGFERQDESAFAWRRVFKDLAKAAAFILGGFVFVAVGASAVRLRFLPDTYFGVFVFLIPAFGLLGWGFFLFIRAMSRAMVGGSSG
jgi:hypothetical protein